MNTQNSKNISSNNNMSVVDEINNLLKLDIQEKGKQSYHPKKLIVGGKPTKKALAFNRRLIKEGKTFSYLDQNKLIRIGKDGTPREVKKKFDKRRKEKVLIKSQKDLPTYGSIISKGNLENKTDAKYSLSINKTFNKNKNKNNSVFKVDLKKMSLANLLDIVKSYQNKNVKYIIQPQGSKNWITLSNANIERLKNYQNLTGDVFGEKAGSDNEFIFQLDAMPEVKVKLIKVNGQKPQGSFFKYYHKLPVDLSKYDIYSEAPKNYNQNCLIKALIEAGLSEDKTNCIKSFVKCGSVPTCKLTAICDKIGIKITLRKPNSKNLLKFGKTGDEYKLGLIDNHYFTLDKTNITSFSINNYELVKDYDDWNTIYKIRDGCARKTKDRFIDSYNLILLLLENKEKLLTAIPTSDILSTQYFNTQEESDNLQYDDKISCKINEPIKSEKNDYPICYFDFETTTDGDNHIPYLCCADFLGEEQTFYGEECGKTLMTWIKKKCEKEQIENMMFVAHNLRYDFTFVMDYLYALKPVLKGNRIMGGTGKLYYGKKSFTNLHFLDSCNLINSKLSGFGKMFNLEQGKEIMPYSIYTNENVARRFIKLDEMLESIDEKDQEQFLTNVNKWACGDSEEIDIIEYSAKYCKIDVDVLKKGFETFRTWIMEVCDLDIKNYCSIASLGLDYIVSQGCFDGCLKICGVPREFIQKCVVGGRCMTRDSKKWKTAKKVADFDAVSLYPSAMARMEGFLKGKPKVIENKSFEWLLKNTDGFFVKALCLNNPTTKRGFPLLSKTNEKTGIRDFTNETKNEVFYLDKTLYQECCKYQGLKFKIICGYYYDEGRNNKINSVIRHLFNARIQAKKQKNPIQAIYKLLMNSCYGKCLLKPIDSENEIVSSNNWDNYLSYNYNFIKDFTELDRGYIVNKIKPINEHFNNVYAGVEILSMSKRIMNEVMCLAEDIKLNMYYTDTDSIHIDEKHIPILEKEYNKLHNRELIGKNMGQFHTDFDLGNCEDVIAIESIFLGKKAYIDKLVGNNNGVQETGYHIRMKGVSSMAIDHYVDTHKTNYMDLYNRLYEIGSLKDGTYFDLLAGGKACKFQYNADMSVSSVSEFQRKVSFTYEKGEVV
jgi:hypothetical protein